MITTYLVYQLGNADHIFLPVQYRHAQYGLDLHSVRTSVIALDTRLSIQRGGPNLHVRYVQQLFRVYTAETDVHYYIELVHFKYIVVFKCSIIIT